MQGKRYAKVMQALTGAGFHYTYESTFSSRLSGARRRGRLICAQKRTSRGLSGASFWIHLSPDTAHLGLWTGQLYRTARTAALPQLVLDILHARQASQGRIPTSLSPALIRRYALVLLDPEAR